MPEDTGPPIDELLERWVAGDRGAAEEIYRRYYQRAWLFAVRLTGREVDADDIAQEAMASGLEGIRGGVRPDRFTGWILGIARHAAQREWRKRHRERATDIDAQRGPAVSGARTGLIRTELDQILQEALAGLGPAEQEALRLRVERGLRREEAAAEMGLPTPQFDRRYDKVMARLREALSRHFTTLVFSGRRGPLTLDAVQRLRPSFRRAFELRHLEGATPQQAALRMAVPVKTLEARLDHAYAELGCGPADDFSALQAEYRLRKRR